MADNQRLVKIYALLQNGQSIQGYMTLLDGGYRSRTTDLLNADKQFISLKNVSIYQGQALLMSKDFLSLNKHSIVFLSIEDEDADAFDQTVY
jgi:hypothetical protein